MALSPKYKVNQQPVGTTAIFTDLTGDYSTGNPGGWNNAVNPNRSSVTAATLKIYFPDPTTGIPDISTSDSNTVDLYARGYPASTLQVYLVPADFLQSAQIQDGIYIFELTISITTLTVPPQTTTYGPVYWNGAFYQLTECCAESKIKNECGCKPSKTREVLEDMWLDFYSLSLNERGCQDVYMMAKALNDAKDLCNEKCRDCGC